jgi:transcriptional regulator with XRE-family HTH domain
MLIATRPPQTATDHVMTIDQAVRACYEGRGYGQDELAERSGIPQQTISRLASGSSVPKFRHLVAIEEACARPRGWILTQAGLVSQATTVEEAIEVDPALDDDHRNALLAAYRGAASKVRAIRGAADDG